MSPGFVAIWTMRWSRRSGLGVENGFSSGNSALISDFAVRLLPTSDLVQRVRGTSPATSRRNRLNLGF